MQYVIPLLMVLLFLDALPSVNAQTITEAVVKRDQGRAFGSLYATIDGKPCKVADSVLYFWVLGSGKAIVFTSSVSSPVSDDGGEAIYYTTSTALLTIDRLLTAATTPADVIVARKRMQRENLLPQGLYASSFHVDSLMEATSKQGKSALLVSLTDRAEIPRFVVLSPKSLLVALWERARLAAFKNNKLTIHFYLRQGKGKMRPQDKPLFVQNLDLDEVLHAGNQ